MQKPLLITQQRSRMCCYPADLGSNTSYVVQAIYHGKPLVGMPMLGDQASNADRVVAKVCAFAFASLQACNDKT